ncbi:MAG: hypothetical protein HZB26_26665 [Candidatus Hydrogenedentes bacterium]|nr:hypothetical protein [Candidatus Hydrogenedentota bacterium]
METKYHAARRWPWGTSFGFAVVGLYISFTVLAIARFPATVSPLTTYLSALGNAEISPRGAIFYDLAVILAGLAGIPFYVAISAHYSQYGRRWLLAIGLVAGVINGVSVFMSGVYAEHVNMDAHVAWSYTIFFSLIAVLLTYSVAFLGAPRGSSVVSWFGFIVCAIDVVALATILIGGRGPGLGSILEWVTVFTLLAWVALVSLDVLRRSRAEGARQER